MVAMPTLAEREHPKDRIVAAVVAGGVLARAPDMAHRVDAPRHLVKIRVAKTGRRSAAPSSNGLGGS